MTYLRLERCAGPRCPRCGCQDCEILRKPLTQPAGALPFFATDPQKAAAWPATAWWNAGRAACRHCFAEFTFRELPPVQQPMQQDDPPEQNSPQPQAPEEEPPRPGDAEPDPSKLTVCPTCRGRYHVYKTRGPVQYRRCKDCGHRGQTDAPPT